jgi:phage terminase Nu1 subunit (DNA packaging protein)
MSVSREAFSSMQVHPDYLPAEWIPLRVASTIVSVSPRTLRRWIGRGLPVYQAGPRTKLLVRVRDIERFLTRKHVPSVDIGKMVDEVVSELKR